MRTYLAIASLIVLGGCVTPQPTVRYADETIIWEQAQVQPASHQQPVANEPSDDSSSIAQLPDKPLTLVEAERIALTNHPSLGVRRATVEIETGRLEQAGLYPNPVIGYHATQVGLFETAGAQGAFVRQRIVTGGKLGLNEQVASNQLDQVQHLLGAMRLQVRNDTRVAFYDLLVAHERLKLAVALVKLSQELVDATRKLLQGKVVSENELLQAEIEAEQALIVRDNTKFQVAASERRLGTVLGITLPANHPIAGELIGELKTLSWKDALRATLTEHPQLQAADAHIERARSAIDRANQQPVPDIDVMVSARHNNFSGDDVANVQVGLPIPVFDGNQGNIRAANGELSRAVSDAKRIQLQIERRLADQFRDYQNARRQVERYQKTILPRAKSSLELVRKAYSQGQTSYLNLITAQRTFIRANLAHLDAWQRYRTALVLIEGKLLLSRQP